MVCNPSFFKYVKNKKQEGIVAFIVLSARDILDSNVLLYHDGEDITFVVSSTTHPKYGPFMLCHPNGHNAIAHL
jgi:hypothetical protein